MSEKMLVEISANLLENFLRLQEIARGNGEADIRKLPEYAPLLSELLDFLNSPDEATAIVGSQQTPLVSATRKVLNKNIFRQLRDAVRSGTARELFPTGTEIPDVWYSSTTKIDAPLIIVNYGTIRTPEGDKEAVTLLRKYVACKRPFDDRTVEFPKSKLARWLATDYASACSLALREVIKDSEIWCDPGTLFTTSWFIPSLEELHFEDSPESWEYFCDTAASLIPSHKKRIFTDVHLQPQCVCLRSRGTSNSVCYVNSDGNVSVGTPSYNGGVLPACVIY